MKNQRKHPRYRMTVTIKISHPQTGEMVVKTQNISDSGVFIVAEPAVMPAIGEIVLGQVQGLAEDAPLVKMQIVRTEKNGLGLQFIES